MADNKDDLKFWAEEFEKLFDSFVNSEKENDGFSRDECAFYAIGVIREKAGKGGNK